MMDVAFAAGLAAKVGRVAGHVVHERIRPPVLRTAADVPRTPDDFNEQWLTAVLCADTPGAEVIAFECFGGETQATGTTTRRRVRVTYNEAGRDLPSELYAKCTTTLTQRLLLGLVDIIPVEGQFYERIRPMVDIEAPGGVFASYEPRSFRSVCLTEDIVATRGADFFTPQDDLTLDQVKDLVAAMATWHGVCWQHPVIDGGWLQTTAERHGRLNNFLDWGKRSAVGFKRAGAGVPAFALERHDDAVRAFERSMHLGSEGAHTLLHGDPHAGGNYYATAEGRMGWADWGVCLRGSWGYDFGYFVAASLPTERRREWEQELLTHYLEQLARAGGEAPEFDDAWLVYRQQTIYPMVAWAAVYGHGPLQPDSQPPEFCVPIIERAAHAVQDLGAIDAVLQPPSRLRSTTP